MSTGPPGPWLAPVGDRRSRLAGAPQVAGALRSCFSRFPKVFKSCWGCILRQALKAGFRHCSWRGRCEAAWLAAIWAGPLVVRASEDGRANREELDALSPAAAAAAAPASCKMLCPPCIPPVMSAKRPFLSLHRTVAPRRMPTFRALFVLLVTTAAGLCGTTADGKTHPRRSLVCVLLPCRAHLCQPELNLTSQPPHPFPAASPPCRRIPAADRLPHLLRCRGREPKSRRQLVQQRPGRRRHQPRGGRRPRRGVHPQPLWRLAMVHQVASKQGGWHPVRRARLQAGRRQRVCSRGDSGHPGSAQHSEGKQARAATVSDALQVWLVGS